MYMNNGYMAGANLGHWISQYGRKGKDHFDSYITEFDIARAAELGFDHLRLPVDYYLFEDDAKPGIYREEGICYIDKTIEWCSKHGLNLVLDLHHAPGYFFGNGAKNSLFTDPEMSKRFKDIWRFFALRYMNEGDNLVFELLNELVWDTSDPWNKLWQETAEVIHEIDPERKIIVGGNRWNSVDELKNLAISPNPNIWYTFHFYLPMLFTHQKAMWNEETRVYNTNVEYPVDSDKHTAYYIHGRPDSEQGILGKDYLEKMLAPASEFILKNKRPLYCGEYGVISFAPLESSIKWHEDIADLLLERGIGRSVWSLRGFAQITDEQNKVISDAMIKAVTRK